MATNLQLYVYTVDEYRRFAEGLKISEINSICDEYSESDYIGIQVRLMLLRKYFASGKNPEKVYIKNIVNDAIQEYPFKSADLKEILVGFEHIERSQIEHIISNGKKLNLYTTVEDTVYGLYLHADAQKIERLCQTTEIMRFVCVRKYVLDVESIVFKLYDILLECGVSVDVMNAVEHSPVVSLGETVEHSQSISLSPYWSNIYGHDATEEDLRGVIKGLSCEELYILNLCLMFVEELKKERLSKVRLLRYVHPTTMFGWGDFTSARQLYLAIPNPGFSTRVRYNEAKDTAYVRIVSKVDNPFFIDTPQIISGINEFALGKWFGKWKIYSFGGHIDSIYERR